MFQKSGEKYKINIKFSKTDFRKCLLSTKACETTFRNILENSFVKSLFQALISYSYNWRRILCWSLCKNPQKCE